MADNSSPLVFVTEKPSLNHELAPYLSRRWPDRKIYAVMLMRMGLYEFRYPRGLLMADYPHVSEPRWKARDVEFQPVWEIKNGRAAPSEIQLEPSHVISAQTDVRFLADPSASTAQQFWVLLDEILGLSRGRTQDRERLVYSLYSMEPAAIEKALDTPTTTHGEQFQGWLKVGQGLRYFDYNFNVNALALLQPELRAVAGRLGEYILLSKYSLQLLYFMQRHGHFSSEAKVLQHMGRWKGTGKHAEHVELGSATSKAQILENLMNLDLIGRVGAEKHKGLEFALKYKGEELLERLHPDCEDADLPFRIAKWAAEWPASKPAIDRYLRTFFGKQKRFAVKQRKGLEGHREPEIKAVMSRNT